MFNYSDFSNGQKQEKETYVLAAPPYDFYEHVVQQNKRDDASRVEYRAPKDRLQAIPYSEACERCGRNLAHVYVLNGKRLCKSCVGDEQDKWVLFTGSPDAAAQRVRMRPKKKASGRSLIYSLISEFLALFGLERIEKEPGTVEPKMPVRLAGRLAVRRPDKTQVPEAEGMMNGIKKQFLFNKIKSSGQRPYGKG